LNPQTTFGPFTAGVSMLQTRMTLTELKAPKREWIHSEYCTGTGDFECLSATYNISQWRQGKIIKLVVATGLSELYDIGSDPTEKNPINDPILLAKMMSLRSLIRDGSS
jgi:hypothetical protein